MNKDYLEAKEFVVKLNRKEIVNSEVLLGVPSLYADTLFQLNEKERVSIMLQNSSSFESGAYTGEVSARMIASTGIKFCLAGHSERRTLYHETNEEIGKKVGQLIKYHVTPILCIGETKQEREQGKTYEVIKDQLESVVEPMSAEDTLKIIIAYEPVWAIGTGLTATEAQAEEVHNFIYQYLENIHGHDVAGRIPILYGGSCNEKNARNLFSQPHIWGGLIGGASLNLDSFSMIIDIAESILNES